MTRQCLLTLSLIFLLAACSDPHIAINDCQATGDTRVYCDIGTPEDIAALPDERHLLLAHFGHMGKDSGGISLFDTDSERLTPLITADTHVNNALHRWGDSACPVLDAATLSPHGTHLHRLDNNRWRYLVVNHAPSGERIELFEVLGSGDATQLRWRGCVLPRAETFVNDVVGLNNGDVIYTRMFKTSMNMATAKGLLGMNTGDLWHWRPETGPVIIPGTEAAQPNGIEIAADNRHVFANMYLTGEVWKVDIATGEVVDKAPVANGDNSAWGPDGRLWVATHTDKLFNVLPCFQQPYQSCGLAYTIVSINPDDMADIKPVYSGKGSPMGAATVAVAQAGRVYMGSFAGDRMISVPLSEFR
ncbi:hypothetical protein BST95_12615 [Halioglobus japonicus]|uniref:SMP-30/Gluconolactonase/LRE-like region domain-containing protein n=1 Tax=Halioglobus japonicus TaxID=930805 RepID=A0AAP8MHL5_9GAMM|nr:SMP-30/gluconolactonase/LRE family protein [Halioglobus japonicus]AQA18957.1 hypothetical protein BST95_12615 [Halioglobus japonicus]PLW88028.1 hypothetical protein C0029_05570 [Halioglobus japonicus]GHD20504.1 hypothetical protein GCM10007052_30240 [Halioglobus japonicus]